MIAHHQHHTEFIPTIGCPICRRPYTADSHIQCTELTPISCEYTPDNLVKVGLRTKGGEVVHATMSATALLDLVHMAVKLMNSNPLLMPIVPATA